MPDVSARLSLPYILPAQAQKHVTHNEALVRLDALVQLVLEEEGRDTPPVSPAAGQVWALGAAPTGEWSGQGGQLAQWTAPGWAFIAPQAGWRGWDRAAGALKIYDGSAWVSDTQNQPGLGIETSWDPVNRLAVASPASLLSHAGSDHQLKINKASAADTASLLFQSNWIGYAEMGLAGDTDFVLKVSADGSTWTDALVIDGATGTAQGAAVQSSPTDTGAGKLARADYAYGPGNLLGTVSQSGGLPTGAVIERISTATGACVRFADGTQICTQDGVTLSHHSGDALRHSWSFPAPFVGNAPTITCSFSLAGADFVGVAPAALGITRQGTGLSTGTVEVSRTHGAPAFTSSSEARNTRLLAVGRWA